MVVMLARTLRALLAHRPLATGRRVVHSGHGVLPQQAPAGALSFIRLSLCLILLISASPSTSQAATPEGARIDNTATVSFRLSGAPDIILSNTTTVMVRTPSTLELLRYQPSPSAEAVTVPLTYYSTSGTAAGPFQVVSGPVPLGGTTPLPVPETLALMPATLFKGGDPLFFRLTDLDQNLDPSMAETILLQVSVPCTGDVEWLRLTETGPDTGIFTGYLPTVVGPASAGDGLLAVDEDCDVIAAYTDPVDGTDSSVAGVLVDPVGMVFDSATGMPVNGATVTLLNVDTGLPADVFGDDGVSSYPSVVVTGTSTTDAGGAFYQFPPGGYRFPMIAPGNYRLQVETPSGYVFPSRTANIEMQTLPAAPFALDIGSRGETFVVNPGPVVRLDLPADPVAGTLWLRKTAGKTSAAVGDFVPYRLTVENTDAAYSTATVTLSDQLPSGFRYRPGSAMLDGQRAADPTISTDGRTLLFTVGDLASGQSRDLRYVAEVASGTRPGLAVNKAIAQGRGALSNNAEAIVQIREDLFRSRAFLMGRVTAGDCDQPPTSRTGMDGVRMLLEDGSFVLTDQNGLFHFEGLRPGTHVVQLDHASLPVQYEAVACEENSRFAGRAFSQFVDLQGGTLWRADFHVGLKARPAGEVRLEMSNVASGTTGQWRLQLHNGAIPLRNLRLAVTLPPEAVYLAGSSRLGEDQLADPVISGGDLLFTLGDADENQRQELSFLAEFEGEETAELPSRAVLTFDSPTRRDQTTSPAETALLRTIQERRESLAEFVIRPRFTVFGTEMEEADRPLLASVADSLRTIDNLRLTVSGHTDNLPISSRSHHLFEDNFALSAARAKSVARYLAELQPLSAEQMTVVGLGDTVPIADNNSPEGRAQNRRVEIHAQGDKIRNQVELQPLRADSGPQTSQAEGLFAGEESPLRDLTDKETGVPAPVDGILSPADGSRLAQPISAVRVQLDSRLKPRLLLDGREIPAERIGFRMADPQTGKTLYSYIGVDFGEPGRRQLQVQGLDPFGNARLDQRIDIIRTGGIVALRVLEVANNIADGKTPVRVRLELLDADGQPLRSAVNLELRAGNLLPHGEAKAETDREQKWSGVRVDADGWAWFQPVSAAGPYQVVLGHNDAEVTVQTYVKPLLRDWILVGLAEGTVGYNTLSGNMEALEGAGIEEQLYKDGRLAFYAKGQVRGEWLLTVAYDSAKTGPEAGLFGTIDPDSYYPLYGDATVRGYDAASSEKLYVRLERDQLYALFGDFNTGLTVTELSRYSRSLTGLKSQWQGEYFDLNLFVSDTDQAFLKEELRGDGTSGLYRLSRRNIVLNSEKITVEVRDRFRSELVLSARTLTRHLDYSIDYQDGTVFFKEPIASQDPSFNPTWIVIDFEVADPAATALTYGGRGALRWPGQRVEMGATLLREEQSGGRLQGVDATWKFGSGSDLRAEFATSETTEAGVEREGSAYLAELRHLSERLSGRLYLREMEEGFGLGQQRGTEGGTRKYGAEGAWRFTARHTLAGQFYRQQNLETGADREVVESTAQYEEKTYRFSLGWRQATDTLADGRSRRSVQGLLGGSWQATDRLTLRLGHEQALGGRDGSGDYPTRTILGGDYQLARAVALFAEQEWTRSDRERTEGTRVGLKSTPWTGGQVHSSVEQRIGENHARVFANIGLKQSWQATPYWAVDGGLDRSQTVKKMEETAAVTDAPAASGDGADFTAVSLGATYKREKWSWANRVEFRDAQMEDKWGVFSGIMGEVRQGLGLSARAQVFHTDGQQSRKTNGELRLGMAHRPMYGRWIILDRLDFIFDRQQGGDFSLDNWRIVNNLNANYQPNRRTQLSLQYGAKYVEETIDGQDYSAFTDLLGLEGRYDLNKRWDLGLRGSVLHSWNSGALDYLVGPSIGYNVVKNAWVSVGYNLLGFHDPDFSRADFTTQGPYLKMRIKFDQDSVREALKWL